MAAQSEEAVRDVHSKVMRLADLEASRKVNSEEVLYLRQSREDLVKEREELLQDLHGY